MDDLIEQINPIKYNKTYPKNSSGHSTLKPEVKAKILNFQINPGPALFDCNTEGLDQNIFDEKEWIPEVKQPLTTRDAVKYLLEGTLKVKVCRYCLNTAVDLSDLNESITVARKGILFAVEIKHMIAAIHPVQIDKDPNLPDKICPTCLDKTISAYLFAQQCDQAERALRNCFEDMYEKFLKLDPIEPKKRRGRQKSKLNHNILTTEHKDVIDYATPMMHIVSTVTEPQKHQKIHDFECLKCSEILPDTVSLLNHVKSHPKNLWFNCRFCGKSFPKLIQIKKHFRKCHTIYNESKHSAFTCKKCGVVTENYQQFYQHKEKHRFRTVMKHLLANDMEKLCNICMDKGSHMVGLDESLNLYGGFPELSGGQNVFFK